MEIQLGKEYRVREGVDVCGVYKAGDVVTPTPAGKGDQATIINGKVRPETVMMSHTKNKMVGLFLDPDMLEEVK